MSPDELPVIISVQDNLVQTINSVEASCMVVRFRDGASLRELAREFLPKHEEGVATNAINQVLKDNIPEDEYRELTRGKGARKQLEVGIGIHRQTPEEKQAAGKRGAKKSGANVYSDAESRRLQELILLPEYRRSTRINAEKIAQVLNCEFHNSQTVRNSANVRKQVSRTVGKIKSILN